MRVRKSVVLAALVPTGLLFGLAGVTGAGPATAASLNALTSSAVSSNMSQSNNWSGYNVGALQSGSLTPITSVSATWTVPTATFKSASGVTSENSAMWTGIGGGCIDSGCTASDSTLIQAGTEQDVDSSGHATYSAWWETVPAPSVDSGLTISPGDQMKVTIAQSAVPELWNVTIQDLTTKKTANAAVNPMPYPSDYSTAEYILETPVTAGTSGAGIGVMPSLSSPAFDLATLNGKSAGLKAGEAIQLVESNGTVEATPSSPDSDADGFNVCTWASSCTAPSSS